MATAPAPTCEVMLDGAWVALSLSEAKRLDAPKRCPVCHGRVTIQGIFTGQGQPTLSHRRTHTGCPLIQRHYSGTPSRHPEPVE